MKKTLGFVLGITLLAACNSSETQSSENTADSSAAALVTVDTNAVAPVETIRYNEGDVILKEGKVLVYTNGNWVVADKEVKLDNGIIITPDGTVKSKEGKVVVLEEGEYISKSGNFFDRTGQAVENAWDKTKEGVSRGAGATKDAAQKAAEATKEGVDKGVEATKDAAQKTGEAIKKGAKKVGDKTKEVIEDIKK
ncbi:DUF6799 domain-containing protein [Niabella drilacis]|uniref:DUF6799 domain-containing protein n=1 Tax=Niabella drilacis (strain DSM 25811 / CCM 8410 / CCUG 62505 / LMG 26954 / E90) TaxID=1285928 RepID=A0A1G6U5Y0_NIADE|nr:DUF6799 domain-containing protein [Niabella drilacis]SDD36768.1 hypothetical protein SAMN04487894_108159 [Niabella drilacis]